MNVNIEYIWHDCFVIRLPECVIVTDYWLDYNGNNQASSLPGFLLDVDPTTPLYVLVSHHHKDHFSRNIFTWARIFSNIRYILSKDTARSVNYILKEGSTYNGEYKVKRDLVTVLRPGDVYSDALLSIKAFGSTDIGNSYMITCSGKHIFHAGDLNAWIWKDESTPTEIEQALLGFKRIVSGIEAAYPAVDVAFFPVDSRIGTDWWEGAAIFVREIDVRFFVPMHFALADIPEEMSRRTADAIDFDNYKNAERGVYLALTKSGANVTLSI